MCYIPKQNIGAGNLSKKVHKSFLWFIYGRQNGIQIIFRPHINWRRCELYFNSYTLHITHTSSDWHAWLGLINRLNAKLKEHWYALSLTCSDFTSSVSRLQSHILRLPPYVFRLTSSVSRLPFSRLLSRDFRLASSLFSLISYDSRLKPSVLLLIVYDMFKIISRLERAIKYRPQARGYEHPE